MFLLSLSLALTLVRRSLLLAGLVLIQGEIAKAIVDCVQSHGGCLTLEDLAAHTSTFDDPIHVNYRGVDVWEIPPNGQGALSWVDL